MGHFSSSIVEPGFIGSRPVRTALLVGTVVAVTGASFILAGSGWTAARGRWRARRLRRAPAPAR
jgi:hypothetical protein